MDPAITLEQLELHSSAQTNDAAPKPSGAATTPSFAPLG